MDINAHLQRAIYTTIQRKLTLLNMPSRSRSRSDSRGRTRSRSPYSNVSADRKDSRSPSRARRTLSPRDASRSPRQNGRYRSASRSVSRDRSASPARSTKVCITLQAGRERCMLIFPRLWLRSSQKMSQKSIWRRYSAHMDRSETWTCH